MDRDAFALCVFGYDFCFVFFRLFCLIPVVVETEGLVLAVRAANGQSKNIRNEIIPGRKAESKPNKERKRLIIQSNVE